MESKSSELLAKFMGEVDSFVKDYTKFFERGNNAAGTRSRKGAQEIKKSLQAMRGLVMDTRKEQKN